MRIAILGATSQIAKDLIQSFAKSNEHELALFARRPEAVVAWLTSVSIEKNWDVAGYENFTASQQFDAVINFVGVGNPAQAAAMGASIFDITLQYDEFALAYVKEYPNCRYIFLSSGAAYGSTFDEPATENTVARIPINNLQPQDWYGVAKLHAECRHRALATLPIVDIRVFNYFSHTQDLEARFFVTDIARALCKALVLETTSTPMMRDYVGPEDFFRLISSVLNSPPANDVVDCYSLAPVEKDVLLEALRRQLGLKYRVRQQAVGVNATGFKAEYYSVNRRAAHYGYQSSMTSLVTVVTHMRKALNAS